jgi:uncharacterized membrane protein
MRGKYRDVVRAFVLANGVSVLFLVFRMAATDSMRYWFLLWNLVLAWLPLIFALLLMYGLRLRRWLSPANIILTVLWLFFLPNSFYLVSDLIHLHETGEISFLFDTVLMTSFIFCAAASGFLSLYLLHRSLISRQGRQNAHALVALVLLLSGFAIYLGRVLRWNTWDILVNPAGVLFDVSEQVVNPVAQPVSVITTLSFFMLLGSVYVFLWSAAEAARRR